MRAFDVLGVSAHALLGRDGEFDFGQTVLSDARTLASLIFSMRGIGQGINSRRLMEVEITGGV